MCGSVKSRKKDRRALYTQAAVKEALLALTRETPYDRINVTQLCQRAEISRATFYLHFDSIDEVLDQLIDDALLYSEEGSGTVVDMIEAISRGDAEALRHNDAILPACQRIADSERYHHLFMSAIIGERIIHRISRHEKGKVVPDLMARYCMNEADALMLFRFMLYGTFAVNRSLGWNKDDRWYHCQEMLGRMIDGGLQALKKAPPS